MQPAATRSSPALSLPATSLLRASMAFCPSFITELLQKNGQDRRNDHCRHQDHRQDGGNDFSFLRIKHSHFFHLISCCPQEDRFFHCGRCGTGDLSCHSRIILPFHQKTPQCGLSSAPDVL